MKNNLVKGDIFFSVNHGGIIHNLISLGETIEKLLMKKPADNNSTQFVHAGIVISPDLIVELGGHGIELNSADKIKIDHSVIFRCRNPEITELAADLGYNLFEAGKSYAYKKAVSSVFKSNKTLNAHDEEELLIQIKQFEFPQSVYCSEFVSLLYEWAKKMLTAASEDRLEHCNSALMSPSSLYDIISSGESNFFQVVTTDETPSPDELNHNLENRLSLLTRLQKRISTLDKEKRRTNHYLLNRSLKNIEHVRANLNHDDRTLPIRPSQLPGLFARSSSNAVMTTQQSVHRHTKGG